MVQVTVGKWGYNLAVRRLSAIAQIAQLRDGEQVEIEVQDGAVVIRRAAPRFVLEELFRGRTGPDVGREIIAE